MSYSIAVLRPLNIFTTYFGSIPLLELRFALLFDRDFLITLEALIIENYGEKE